MRKISMLFIILSVILCVSSVFAAPVDLSTFVAEPNDSGIVDIGTDTITFYESMDYGFIYAANDFFSVDENATELTYGYSLTPGTTDDYDWLVALVDDSYVMEIEQIGAGSFSIDMTAYQGQTISLVFGLEYDWENDWGYDSIGTISNIDIAVPDASVPEPGTIILLSIGILGLAGIRRIIG